MNKNSLSNIVMSNKYLQTRFDGSVENWDDLCFRIVQNVVVPYLPNMALQIYNHLCSQYFMAGGRYNYAAGKPTHAINNCMLFDVKDSRQAWGDLSSKAINSLMLGAGIGVNYSQLRGSGVKVNGLGGTSSGPLSLMEMINSSARYVIQGGSRRSAVWAGLKWDHPDIFQFIDAKVWPDWLTKRKAVDIDTPAPLDKTNISVILDDNFFEAIGCEHHHAHELAVKVFEKTMYNALVHGDPGFSVDVGVNSGEHLRNACTEVTSRDDFEVCNLGSANLSKIPNIDEFRKVVQSGVALLLCGSLYSYYPFPEMEKVVEDNRRIGLGIMGFHHWLLQRNYQYDVNAELGQWLDVYATESDLWSNRFADKLRIAKPIKKRAIAPNGSIGIVAETTPGIEPIFAVAYKRRYYENMEIKEKYIIDPIAQELTTNHGIPIDDIEDSYTLAQDPERRLRFQSFVQEHVDMGISSTLNMPHWGSEFNNENTLKKISDITLKYLPQLRGVTFYPDGARGGQPLTKVSYEEAMINQADLEYRETTCKDGICGE